MLYGLAGLVVLLALTPAAIWVIGFAKRHRPQAAVAGGLLLIFGLNMHANTPPPPPQVEVVEHEEEKAGDDEPKD